MQTPSSHHVQSPYPINVISGCELFRGFFPTPSETVPAYGIETRASSQHTATEELSTAITQAL